MEVALSSRASHNLPVPVSTPPGTLLAELREYNLEQQRRAQGEVLSPDGLPDEPALSARSKGKMQSRSGFLWLPCGLPNSSTAPHNPPRLSKSSTTSHNLPPKPFTALRNLHSLSVLHSPRKSFRAPHGPQIFSEFPQPPHSPMATSDAS